MLSELGSTVKLIDGNEASYYLSAADFNRGRADSYGKLATAFLEPADAALYRGQVELAQAVYLDGLLNLAASPQFFGYYLKDDAERFRMLEHNLFYGLKTSDAYVWVYAERTRWWAKENVPPELEPLVKRVKNTFVTSKTLKFGATFIGGAKEAFEARVRTGGTIAPNVPAVKLRLEGLPDTACVTYNDGGKYSCTFPAGSTVTPTPVAAGISFRPPFYTYDLKTGPTDPYAQNFSAQ